MLIALILVWLLFIFMFYRAMAAEIKRTHWDLLESLIVVNFLGHPVAIGIWLVMRDFEKHPTFYKEHGGLAQTIVMAGMGGTIVSMLMFGGVVWVFRRLKILEITGRKERLFYMVLGLFLFPSIITAPVSFFVGWAIWIMLYTVNNRYEVEMDRLKYLKHRGVRL